MDVLDDVAFEKLLRSWVTELRRGEIKQIRRELLKVDPVTDMPRCACCLGLLCLEGVKSGLLYREPGIEWVINRIGGKLVEEDNDELPPRHYTKRLFGRQVFHNQTARDIDPRAVVVDVDRVQLQVRWNDDPAKRRQLELMMKKAQDSRGQIALSVLNDKIRMSFNMIADVVECSRTLNGRVNPLYVAKV